MDIFAPDSPAALSDGLERAAANARQILNILNFVASLFVKTADFRQITSNRIVAYRLPGKARARPSFSRK
jgi:hypothetical protein